MNLTMEELRMNIDDMTIGQARQIAAMFGQINGAAVDAAGQCPHIGKECVIRTYASGVHFGVLLFQDGRQVELKNARRLWKWHAIDGISLSEVATGGIDQSKSRICIAVPQMTILDAIEIIPATSTAAETIRNAPVASK